MLITCGNCGKSVQIDDNGEEVLDVWCSMECASIIAYEKRMMLIKRRAIRDFNNKVLGLS